MSSNPKKRKIDEEGHVFNKNCTFDYFFISHADSALCLICHESIKTLKTFNIRRHCESRHKNYFSLQGDVRSNKISSSKKSVSAQQISLKAKLVRSNHAFVPATSLPSIYVKKESHLLMGNMLKSA